MEGPLTLEGVISFLLETPLFADLDATELAEIVKIMQVQRLRAGQTVFREGDPGDAWYVLFEGTAGVSKEGVAGAARDIARLEAHACFGEMAVIDGSARSATIRAQSDLTLFRFRRGSFQDLLEEGSLAAYKLVLAMARILSQRHRRLTQQISELVEQDHAHKGQSPLGTLADSYKVSE
jgi:CRP-like cAMP-binding protein